MTTAMSKRNQARNERALQDVLKTVAGNDRCADCGARNPGWASWSLGIFLCMRCAAIHRKLGTHISKVKSLSMDSWSNEQVEHMKNMGNTKSNRIYNPKGKAPIVPIDQDEVDGAVEWFIKQKYVQKSFQEGAQSENVQQIHRNQIFGDRDVLESPRNMALAESEPVTPTLPQAKGKKFSFGLRSASSTFGLNKKNRERKASLPTGKVVGATIGLKEDGTEWKLVTLKEMGFADEKRNTEILKGMNGDLERTIESLVRLGQGPSRPGLTKKVSTTFPSSQSIPQRTHKPPPIPSSSAGVFGASVQQSPQSTGFGAQSSTSSPSYRKASHNPFDNVQPPSTQASQSNIDQAFSNMSISQPMSTQSTGILPSQQAPQQAYYQQSMTPPPNSNLQQSYGFNPYMQQQQQYYQPQQAPALQSQATGYNPFLQQQQQQQQPQQLYQQQTPQAPQSNPFIAQQIQSQATGNPFLQMQQPQTPTSNPFLQQQNNVNAYSSNTQYQQQPQYTGQRSVAQSPNGYQSAQSTGFGVQQQEPQHQVQSPYQGQQQQYTTPEIQGQQNPGAYNPFLQMQQQQQQPQQQPQFVQQQPQQPQFAQQAQYPQPQTLMPQATGRMNKQSILALYGTQPSIPENAEPQIPQRSVTMPATMTGSNNPFGTVPAAGASTQMQSRGNARVRDSIFAGTDDPFASLSSKIR